MTKYMVYSSETTYYQNEVEADSPEEARELLLSGGYDLDEYNFADFGVDAVEEILEDAEL